VCAEQKRTRLQPPPPVGKAADDGSSSSSINRSQETRTDSQNILQTLASQGSAVNLINADRPSSQRPIPSGGSQIDVAGLMSQVLHSPALNGLLEGFSQQTGVDSPDGIRNMLQQFTQSPQMMNTVNQIAQHVGSQDMGNMLTGTGRGQGGGVDFSRMFQQMMPIVSQALGGGNPPSLFSAAEPETRAPYRNENSDNRSLEVCIHVQTERHSLLPQYAFLFELLRSIKFLLATNFGTRWKSFSAHTVLLEALRVCVCDISWLACKPSRYVS
jgi:hypothetical protein